MKEALKWIVGLNVGIAAAIYLFCSIVYVDELIDSWLTLGLLVAIFGIYNVVIGVVLLILSVAKASIRRYVYALLLVGAVLMVSGWCVMWCNKF